MQAHVLVVVFPVEKTVNKTRTPNVQLIIVIFKLKPGKLSDYNTCSVMEGDTHNKMMTDERMD